MGHKGMQYILPTRADDCGADSIEAMAEAQDADGLILLEAVKQDHSGMLMGAMGG